MSNSGRINRTRLFLVASSICVVVMYLCTGVAPPLADNLTTPTRTVDSVDSVAGVVGDASLSAASREPFVVGHGDTEDFKAPAAGNIQVAFVSQQREASVWLYAQLLDSRGAPVTSVRSADANLVIFPDVRAGDYLIRTPIQRTVAIKHSGSITRIEIPITRHAWLVRVVDGAYRPLDGARVNLWGDVPSGERFTVANNTGELGVHEGSDRFFVSAEAPGRCESIPILLTSKNYGTLVIALDQLAASVRCRIVDAHGRCLPDTTIRVGRSRVQYDAQGRRLPPPIGSIAFTVFAVTWNGCWLSAVLGQAFLE
jgi:hypothetical protein